MSRRTPLHAQHQARGARFVEFAGWEMPLHFGSQIAEHRAVRTAAGLFDVSHMGILDVGGPLARAFLRHALAADVDRLAGPGRGLYGLLLDDSGGILEDLIVFDLGEGVFRLVLNAATWTADLEWLRGPGGASAPEVILIERRDLAMLALQGPRARAVLRAALPAWWPDLEPLERFAGAFHREAFVSRTGYTGEEGFEIMLPAPWAGPVWDRLVAAGAAPCGLGARDTLRLEAGLRLNGQDMDRSTIPAEAGLDWTVHRSSGRDFIGRAALAGRSPRFRLSGIVLRGEGVMRSGQTLDTAAGGGRVTSGSFSPLLARSVALARVPTALKDGDPVRVGVRNGPADAVAVPLPFVRAGASQVERFLHEVPE